MCLIDPDIVVDALFYKSLIYFFTNTQPPAAPSARQKSKKTTKTNLFYNHFEHYSSYRPRTPGREYS